MVDYWKIYSVCAVLAAACPFFFTGCGITQSSQPDSYETVLDVGTIVADGSVSKRIVSVKNPFNFPATVTAKWNCGCVRVEPALLSLDPGESKPVTVLITPSASTDHINSTIFFSDRNSKNAIRQVTVQGTVSPWLVFSSQVVQINASDTVGSQVITLTTRNLRPIPFDGFCRITGRVAAYVRNVDQTVLVDASSTGTIPLVAMYPGPTRVRGSLEIMRDPNEKPLLSLPLVLTGVPSVRVTPPSAILTKAGSEAVIKLARTDGKDFSLDDIRLDRNAPLTVDRSVKHKSRQHELRLRADSGAFAWQGTISIVTITDERVQNTATLPVFIESAR